MHKNEIPMENEVVNFTDDAVTGPKLAATDASPKTARRKVLSIVQPNLF